MIATQAHVQKTKDELELRPIDDAQRMKALEIVKAYTIMKSANSKTIW